MRSGICPAKRIHLRSQWGRICPNLSSELKVCPYYSRLAKYTISVRAGLACTHDFAICISTMDLSSETQANLLNMNSVMYSIVSCISLFHYNVYYLVELILKISSRSLSIAALRVRTFENFDPVTINSCRSNLYNTGNYSLHN